VTSAAGTIIRPICSTEKPRTFCRKNGTKNRVDAMPMNSTSAASAPSANSALRNSARSSTGAGARRSAARNSTNSAADVPAPASVAGSSQPMPGPSESVSNTPTRNSENVSAPA